MIALKIVKLMLRWTKSIYRSFNIFLGKLNLVMQSFFMAKQFMVPQEIILPLTEGEHLQRGGLEMTLLSLRTDQKYRQLLLAI